MDFDNINLIASAWYSPLSFVFHDGKDLVFNGKDIYNYINEAVEFFKKKQYYNFGLKIGHASEKIFAGK